MENDDGSDRQRIIRKHVKRGSELLARREPDNPYDDDAIGLWVKGGLIFRRLKQVGYIGSNLTGEMAAYMDSGGDLSVTVTKVTGGRGQNSGVNIEISKI